MTQASKGGAALTGAALPDLVYPLKPVGDCDELRYSLRSVATNAEGLYRKVWVVVTDAAALPEWLTGVEVIEAGSPDGRTADVRAKYVAVVNDKRVASRVVLMADDAFLMDPIDDWPAYHMGPTSEYLAQLRAQGLSGTRGWIRAISDTADWMAERGHGDILCRQGHRPLPWHTKRLAKALAEYPADRALDVLGLYDLAGAGGVGEELRISKGRPGNAKVNSDAASFHEKVGVLDIPWLSSNEQGFAGGMIGGYIRGCFREPSRYEREV